MPELYKIIHNLVIFFLEEGRATLIVQKKYTHTHIYMYVYVYIKFVYHSLVKRFHQKYIECGN